MVTITMVYNCPLPHTAARVLPPSHLRYSLFLPSPMSATSSHLQHYQLQLRMSAIPEKLVSFLPRPDSVSYHISCSPKWPPQQALSSAHCTSPSEPCQFICLSTAQAAHQAICSAPCNSSGWQSCSASFPISSYLPIQVICCPYTMADFLWGWPVPGDAGSSTP